VPIERVDVVDGGRRRDATVESRDCALGAAVDGGAWSIPFFFARGES